MRFNEQSLKSFSVFTLFCIVFLSISIAVKAESPKVNELRIHLGSKPPVDPLFLISMDEYDLSLILYRSWFEYDKSRKAMPGLIKTWSFNEKTGTYVFKVADHKWSDGTPLIANHFVENLKRIVRSATQYGNAVSAAIDLNSLRSTSESEFQFQTVSKKPSDAFFGQLGSVFLALVYPNDLDTKGIRLIRNTKTIGPYKIKLEDKDITIYEPNPYFQSTNLRAPKQIVVKPKTALFSMDDFLAQKTWANYFQTSSILPLSIAKKIIDSKFPIWTRGFDRVALLRPNGKNKESLDTQREILKLIGFEIQKIKDFNHPLNVSIAKSLQPIGYPLFKEINYSKSEPKYKLPEKVTIFSNEMPALQYYKEWFKALESKLNLKFEWKTVPSEIFLKTDWYDSDCDFTLFSFGVADPESTTWLSLVFQSRFIHYEPEEKLKFEKIIKNPNVSKQVNEYRELLQSIGSKGGYLPLFHGATLSIGTPGMDFRLVGDLDETVDYSKIQFTK